MSKFSLRMSAIEKAVGQMEAGPPAPRPITADMSAVDAAKNVDAAYARYRRPPGLDDPMSPAELAQASDAYAALLRGETPK